MNKDDLRIVWICDDCRAVLVFHDDGEVHCRQTGHQHLTAYDIETGRTIENKEIFCSQAAS
jgi:hypothetical protein